MIKDTILPLKETGGEDYAAKLEDTTINYFYALYILSRCDAFLCSGQCNGWDNVLWIRPTITYGLVACFVSETEEK